MAETRREQGTGSLIMVQSTDRHDPRALSETSSTGVDTIPRQSHSSGCTINHPQSLVDLKSDRRPNRRDPEMLRSWANRLIEAAWLASSLMRLISEIVNGLPIHSAGPLRRRASKIFGSTLNVVMCIFVRSRLWRLKLAENAPKVPSENKGSAEADIALFSDKDGLTCGAARLEGRPKPPVAVETRKYLHSNRYFLDSAWRQVASTSNFGAHPL